MNCSLLLKESLDNKSALVLGNSLAPSRPQAIVWTKNGLDFWCIYASFVLNGLRVGVAHKYCPYERYGFLFVYLLAIYSTLWLVKNVDFCILYSGIILDRLYFDAIGVKCSWLHGMKMMFNLDDFVLYYLKLLHLFERLIITINRNQYRHF